jgi:hypothetical protein
MFLHVDQGDQMSLRKNRPRCGPKTFLLELINEFTVDKSS